MLKKIQQINKLGVFDDFRWDHEVKNAGGAVQSFADINVIYGRNYSGKTTLSRIVRALEVGKISDKYGLPAFSLKLSGDSEVTHANLTVHGKIIRVFNEDFVRENLRFITNPDDSIESFAILGDDNNKIEKEIEELEAELGSNEEGDESGLFAKQKSATDDYKVAYQSHKKAKDSLRGQLGDKATSKEIGIKYKPEYFGDQNYTITKLEADIKKVQKSDFQRLTADKVTEYENTIVEKVLPDAPKFVSPKPAIAIFIKEAKLLVEKKISGSDKIEDLVKDAVLNRWVNEGRAHHRNKHEKCAFCNNAISDDRWAILDKHFDEESDLLEKNIRSLIARVETEKKTVNKDLMVTSPSRFYSKFHSQLSDLSPKIESAITQYHKALEALIEQLETRKNDILNTKVFFPPADCLPELENVWEAYQALCDESDSFSVSLSGEQSNCRAMLRLEEVANYLVTIDYSSQLDSIALLEDTLEKANNKKSIILSEITQKKALISAKKRELNDEEKGAKKVNEYLNNFFGHKFLTLEAIRNEGDDESSKRIRFEVIRDGKKAYHLSEGECSLLAFCYFLAKLDDIETKNSKPIIWIDDPISSLDGNHIFFIYSLISAEIISKGTLGQLFVSTHNLDFLKYLKKLKDSFIDESGEKVKFQKAYFIVVRQGKNSTIQVMPSYLKEYVTEFNYLFHQIHKCAAIEGVDDTNYITFYNFPNNARKFFEIYLYYKYPDQGMNEKTLDLFFGEGSVPSILTDRINNEYSHMSGVFERGATPVEVPEMQLAAKKIIEKLKEDRAQYLALLQSVGESSGED